MLNDFMQGTAGQTAEVPIPVDAVRLVYPLPDPETGVTRDVIINELRAVPPNMQSPNMSFDRWEYGVKWDRLVPGLNVVIPWPETKTPEFVTYDADTTREAVEDRSFYYNLLSLPVPAPVLDELRNKYSRFRTRHEPAYVERKMMEEVNKKGRASLLQSMRTPLEEFHEKQRQLKAARGEPKLTEEMLSKIGEVIARNKAEALENAGMSEMERATDISAPTTSSSPSSTL